MRKSILVLSLLVTLLSNPLRAEETQSLEAQVKELTRKVEALEDDLDQVRKLSDDALFWLRLSDIVCPPLGAMHPLQSSTTRRNSPCPSVPA